MMTDETNLAASLVIHCYGYIPSLLYTPTSRSGEIERFALWLLEGDDGKALEGRGGALAAAALLRAVAE